MHPPALELPVKEHLKTVALVIVGVILAKIISAKLPASLGGGAA